MTDEQMLQYLKDAHIHKVTSLGRDPSKYSTLLSLAANRIEALVKENDALVAERDAAIARAEQAEQRVKPLEWKDLGLGWAAYDPLFETQVVTEDREKYDAERATRILSALSIPTDARAALAGEEPKP